MIVKEELSKLGLHFTRVELGEAEIMENMNTQQHDEMKIALHKWGLEALTQKNHKHMPVV